MRVSMLTYIGFELNGALDSGKYDYITIAEVKERIEDRSVFDFLVQKLGEDVDFSLVKAEDRDELMAEWADYAVAIHEDRKMGVERRGLCLLVAYLLEGIQRRARGNHDRTRDEEEVIAQAG